MKILPFFLMTLFLLSSPILAQTQDYCQDNTTLMKVSTTTINVPEKNITRTINATEPFICEHGCHVELGECYPSQSNGWFIGIGVVAGFVIIYFIFRVLFG